MRTNKTIEVSDIRLTPRQKVQHSFANRRVGFSSIETARQPINIEQIMIRSAPGIKQITDMSVAVRRPRILERVHATQLDSNGFRASNLHRLSKGRRSRSQKYNIAATVWEISRDQTRPSDCHNYHGHQIHLRSTHPSRCPRITPPGRDYAST